MEKALQRIISTNEDGFGVFSSKWFPYTTMVTVLAALLHYVESNKQYLTEGLALIKKWYWTSVFLERYAGSTDSTTYSDYTGIVEYLEKKMEDPKFFKDAKDEIQNNPNFSLRDVSRRNAIYKGVINLIAIKGAKDFLADDSIEFHDLDDHHIFPTKYLSTLKESDDKINCVLNKTLISSSTNRKISRTQPSIYITKLIPNEKIDGILASHFINKKATEALMNDDFEGFMEAREKELIKKIREITG